MPTTIDDLKPKSFTIDVKGLKLQSKPLRLSHTLVLAKIGTVIQEADKLSAEDITAVQNDLDTVFGDLVPELKGVELDMPTTLEVIQQLMENTQPSDNKELNEVGVEFTDPKAEGVGQ